MTDNIVWDQPAQPQAASAIQWDAPMATKDEATAMSAQAWSGGDSASNPAYSQPDVQYDQAMPTDLPSAIAQAKSPQIKAVLQAEYQKRQQAMNVAGIQWD